MPSARLVPPVYTRICRSQRELTYTHSKRHRAKQDLEAAKNIVTQTNTIVSQRDGMPAKQGSSFVRGQLFSLDILFYTRLDSARRVRRGRASVETIVPTKRVGISVASAISLYSHSCRHAIDKSTRHSPVGHPGTELHDILLAVVR